MRPPRMTADDVGDYYVDAQGAIWRLVGYASQPTPARVGGVVGAPIFEGFRKLVPEEEV